jgi:hypothetical protein
MGTELATIEPLALPDRRRPAQIPSLPEWVVSRLESLKDNWQNGKTTLTLPATMVLSETQRTMVLSHIAALGSFVETNPGNSADAEAQTLVAVTKMLLALPAPKSSEAGNEAKGEAYLAALDDIAPWAVQEAIRKWYRGEHGAGYDYRWSPVPSDLRKLAQNEEYRVRGRMRVLQRICEAEAIVEFSDEHREQMLGKLQGLFKPPTVEAAE